jgi:DNA-directed RNA polymerase specialized sigma24 family protein
MLAEVEKDQMVRDAIDQLPARCKQMIELLFFEHPPIAYAEIARRLQLARGSIGFIRGRCLKRLKKALEQKGF